MFFCHALVRGELEADGEADGGRYGRAEEQGGVESPLADGAEGGPIKDGVA